MPPCLEAQTYTSSLRELESRPHAPPQATQSLTGFSAEFVDLRDYILKISYAIWEGRGVDLCKDWYSEDCPVKTPNGIVVGSDVVIKATHNTLSIFPDRVLLGEDVIHSDEGGGRYYSSHRIYSNMTHLGSSEQFGEATGLPVEVRTIADCVCEADQIIDEWLVRDVAAIVLQIGGTVREYAADRLRKGNNVDAQELLSHWATGGNPSPVVRNARVLQTIELYRSFLGSCSDGGDDRFDPVYDRAAAMEGPGGKRVVGCKKARAFHAELFSPFKLQPAKLHHTIVREDAGEPVRVSLRFSIGGTHSATGRYGAPSGRQVALVGIVHLELREGRVIREFLLLDEVSVWMQLLKA